jgi:cyclophilin family peptidyl-prolyl cis-trans isomerase/protein-disulfide isomerase
LQMDDRRKLSIVVEDIIKRCFMFVCIFLLLSISACKGSDDEEIDQGDFYATLQSGPKSSEAVCTAQSQPEVDVAEADDWICGSEDYAVTIIEYCGYQSPACNLFFPTYKKLVEEFSDDVRFIFRQLPQESFDKDHLAAQAAEAAGLQDHYWEMNTVLNEGFDQWVDMPVEEFEVWLQEQAAQLGLDEEQFLSDLKSDQVITKVDKDIEDAQEAGIDSGPALLIDGGSVPSQFYNYESMQPLLKNYSIPLGKLTKIQFSQCPPMQIDLNAQYTATLHTEVGDIVIALFPDIAPFAVNSFIFLAEHDYYDNVTFHRVIKDFVAQGGDPSGTGKGSPGYYFSIEISPELKFNREGLFAMANSGPTSNGSQFFITLGPAEHLNDQYTIFGEVLEGMDVVRKLKIRDPQEDPFAPPGTIIYDVTIEKK